MNTPVLCWFIEKFLKRYEVSSVPKHVAIRHVKDPLYFYKAAIKYKVFI